MQLSSAYRLPPTAYRLPLGRACVVLLLVLAAASVALGMPAMAQAASRWSPAVATAVYVDMFELGAGESVEFVTENQSSGADPVLHLFRVLQDGSYQQVAVADDMQWPVNPNAYISYFNSGAAGSFVLLLRAYSTAASGVCDVRMDTVLRQAAAPVGGWLAPSSAFVFAAGDRLRTVHLPGGSEMELVLGLQDAYLPTSLAIANSIAGAAEFGVDGTESLFLFGSPQVRTSPTDYFDNFRAGFVWAAFNDPADADGDGLGDELEEAIGTCGTVANCCAVGDPPLTCAQGYGGKDSDRDGLSDGEELFGVAGVLPFGDDELDLPRWGAKPQRKDVFVEVDHSSLFASLVVPENTSPFGWMRNNAGGLPNAGYTGVEDFAAIGRAPFLAGPATHVRNRDGSAGIALHMDLGVQPLNPSDEEKFGAYPSASPRALVPDLRVRITGPIPAPGLVSLTINGTTWSFDATGMTAEQVGATIALSTLFVPEFSDAVHYVWPMEVTNSQDVIIRLAGNTPGVHFTRGVAPAGNLSMLGMSDKEAYMHADENSQFDAVRKGRFHYAVAQSEGGAGQAMISAARFAGGLTKLTFFHELGHSIGIRHWGHDSWGQKAVECMPHYRSLMNYDKKNYAFNALEDPLTINPGALSEVATFGPSWQGSYADFLGDPYFYTTPTSSPGVDWNRDGQLSSTGLWRGAALTVRNKSCQSYAQGRTIIDAEPAITGPVDLVRFGAFLYAFWSNGSSLRGQSAALGSAGAKSCTGAAGSTPGACLSWNDTFTLATMPNGALGVTALSHVGTLFVASTTSQGTLVIMRYVPGPLLPLTVVDTQQYLPDANNMLARGTPELVVRHSLASGPVLTLLYHGRDHTYRSFVWNGSTWNDEGALIDDATNAAITAPQAGDGPAAKAWPDPTLQPAWPAHEYRTLAVLPATTGEARLFVHTGVGNRWRDVQAGLAGSAVVGKPFLEFRPVRSATGLPDALFSGHFLLGWQGGCTGGNCAWVQARALVSKSNLPAVGNLWGLPESDWLQNTWAIVQPGTSVALFSEATLDNVFGLFPSGVPNETGVTFYPHADGAPLQTYSAYSDFRLMEDYVCLSVGGQQSPANSCGVTPSSPLNVFN